jgi:hypothetical protein
VNPGLWRAAKLLDISRCSYTPSPEGGTKIKHSWQQNKPRGLIMESDILSASDGSFSFFAKGDPRNRISLNDK